MKKELAMVCSALLTLSLLCSCGENMEMADKTNDKKSVVSEAHSSAAVDVGDGDGGAEAAGELAANSDRTEGLPAEQYETEHYYEAGEPFVLTAGEWNDNENWGFITNLVHTGAVEFPVYGLDPTHRITVNVTSGGVPVRNQKVTAYADDGAAIWSAHTDANGTAYLFYGHSPQEFNLTLKTNGAEDMRVTIPADPEGEQDSSARAEQVFSVETSEPAGQYTDTEVMFILDTTGSMGDEITFLQKDFASIAAEVADQNMRFSVNFYRDEGDEYVTKCNPFTGDVKEVQRLLNQEYADGGGDIPEAVAEILEETITNGSWSENTNKIAFLIFDAPPHSGQAEEAQIIRAVDSAAAMGIHLVPVVASNAARETELFGRALAIMTNSRYVFLTDDSGVGESHLEPIIGDYDVELLHDIIVRAIREVVSPTD